MSFEHNQQNIWIFCFQLSPCRCSTGLCHFLFISFVEFDDGLYTLAEYVERHVLVG